MIGFVEALRSTHDNYQRTSKPIPVIKRHTQKQKPIVWLKAHVAFNVEAEPKSQNAVTLRTEMNYGEMLHLGTAIRCAEQQQNAIGC